MNQDERRNLEIGLRVLACFVERKQPPPADVSALRRCAPDGEDTVPADELARNVIRRARFLGSGQPGARKDPASRGGGRISKSDNEYYVNYNPGCLDPSRLA